MKLFTLLLCVNLIHISANVYSQNERFTVKTDKIQVRELLDKIESESNYKFLYRSDYLNASYVKLDAHDLSIKELLTEVVKQTDINYKILDDKLIVVAPKSLMETQQLQISGTITDASTGEPLPGVNILIEGTTTGAITDQEGKYSLKLPSANSILVFSYIGYNSERIETGNRSIIDVSLIPNIENLNEVVVIGYGTQKKKDLTGSIVSVKLDRVDQTPTTDLSQALQGYTAGLNATGGSLAGEQGGLSIRGKTSLSASDNPLIVVDGIIYHGSTTDINVNDIASIDVLKDASAAAVYGSRSANGVIAITTKTGKTKKPTFNFNAYYGMQNLSNTKRTQIMDGEQYAMRLVDYYYQQNLYNWYKTKPASADARPVRPDVTDRNIVASYLRTAEEQANYLAGNEVDWIDEVTRTAPIQSYNLSVSGQTERTNYFLSTSYTDQKGILLNDEFKRLTFFSKFENKITDWFTVEFAPTYTHLDYSGIDVGMNYALQASPWGNIYDSDGKYPVYIAEESYVYHPLGHTLASNDNPSDNINLVLKGKISVPWIKGLNYEANYSNLYIFDSNASYYPKSIAEGSKTDGEANKSSSRERKWLFNNILSYDKILGNHKINVTTLFSRENLKGDGTTTVAKGFGNETLGFNAMELAETQTVSTSAWEENTISYMGRINYIYNSRYLITGTIRRDGFSGFGANNKFGNFPSVSLGWVVSEESFLRKFDWLDFLKVRLSYGINGNQGIGRYSSQATMGSNNTVFGGATAVGIYASSLGNNNLGWEKTASANTGLDFGFLNQRISGNIDFYQTNTTDVLVKRSVPKTTGYGDVWTNIGGIKNHGIEISLTTQNIKTSNFIWTSSFAYSRVRNEITKLYDDITEDIGNSWFVGEPISAIYGYNNIGVWQEEDLFNGTITNGFYPGQFKVKDLNNDGAITAEKDREIIGYSTPNYRISMNNVLTYKNITFSFFLNSVQGGNGYFMGSNSGALVAGGTDEAYRLNRTAVRAYWRPDAPVNNAPGMYYSPSINPGVYQDKSYIRLQDVSLSYDFSKNILTKLSLSGLQVYLSGRNLYTWTDWAGWDPEIGAPLIRSFIGGVKVSF